MRRKLFEFGLAFGTFIAGLFLSPYVNNWYNETFNVTPSSLAKLLESGDVSKFNEERKKVKEQIVFDRIDLSGNLEGANLNSIIILHSNLSNANLQNSELENAQISGDLSRIDLRNAILMNADLTGANFIDANLTGALLPDADLTGANLVIANLTNANLDLANLNQAIFDCESLGTADLTTVNVSQIHIIDTTGDFVSSCN
jgi:uncharacterized protein YjbI with pentapeptide repeats